MILLIGIDGVLLDDQDVLYDCYKNAFLRAMDLKLSRKTFDDFIHGKVWADAARVCGIPKCQSSKFLALFNEALSQRVLKYDHRMAKFVCSIAEVTTCIMFVTSGCRDESVFKVAHSLIGPDRNIVDSVDKSDKKSWVLLLEQLGIDAEDCMLIDSHIENCEAAKKVGILAIHWRIV